MVRGGFRAVSRCDELALPPFSDSAQGLTRIYLSPAYDAAQDQLAAWMAEAGMTVRRDAAMNLVGRYEGTAPEAPALMIGSHLDSVRNAGHYDGPLGIMLGIEAVAALSSASVRMPFALEVYAFGDEEGSRFPAAMLTSRAVAGTLDPATLDVADADGVKLAEIVDIAAYSAAARARGSVLAYLEAHIEQGPVLEAEGLAVGTVTGIAAQLRFEIEVGGTAGHAGTTAMGLRRDAVAGMAEMVMSVEAVATAGPPDLVATVGVVQVPSGAANVIAGKCAFTLDVRAATAPMRDAAAEEILRHFRKSANERDLSLAVRMVHDLPASPCDPALMNLLDNATIAAGHTPFRLVSGAGHDAMVMAALCPTAMLFIRCRGGVSHNPAEHVHPADADVALRVMLGFIERLGATVDPA
ncbi:allantoate amidohydrolase [Novosphingobium sp. CECT 9465]|uniref:allantoate amidohydrolase n=1 Tax=Novosphingobium sp. CECT 9465 TaxID=2829794 RepID=UPI001E28512F|nr:allantoate amidohydrolase [Novosphingobium sp. CECT 9465]CAH0496180.1 N-carbamoyl-L-amino acid hydrolase [Novosphingobium sp. CECT 9465]